MTEDLQKELSLRRARRFATLLLLFMIVLFLGAKQYETTYVWMGFIKAFAEAAIVGALADWFAVTALFRFPLGIRFPHTAIIPTNKERIGKSLGNFVEKNFLTPDAITEKLRSLDIAGKSADWLARPENISRTANELCLIIPKILDTLHDRDIQHFIRTNVTSGIRSLNLAPVLGDAFSILTTRNKHQALFDQTILFLNDLFEKYRPELQDRITKESSWFFLLLDGDTRLYNKIVSVVKQTLEEIAANPDHELRRKFHDATHRFVLDLKSSPEYSAKVEEIKMDILSNPVIAGYLDNVWTDIKTLILSDLGADDSRIRAQMKKAVQTVYTGLLSDPSVRAKLNSWVQNALISTVSKHRSDISHLISEKVNSWDARTITRKLELEVGKDLQFIRINGTVIGGCIGLLIHLVSTIF